MLKNAKLINKAIQFKKIELAFYENKEGSIREKYNPYDYDQLDVIATITSPNNEIVKVPLFWFIDYKIELDTKYKNGPIFVDGLPSHNPDEPHGMENVKTVGEYHYRLRFTPKEEGNYKIVVTLTSNKTVIQTIEDTIKVTKGVKPQGIIKVDETNNRAFTYEDGKTFIPNGVNMCWWTDGARKTTDYEVWFKEAVPNNVNMIRVWMATWGFCLHWGEKYNDYDDRLDRAALLDKLFNLIDENNIVIMLTMLNHGQFSETNNAEWNSNPYNKKNGGILDRPQEFYSNAEAIRTYKNEVKYLMARYSYSYNVMCWELFNEIDWTWCQHHDQPLPGLEHVAEDAKNWHQEIISVIKEFDPNKHMITTSYGGHDGLAYSLEDISFTNPHDYHYEQIHLKNVNTDLHVTQELLYTKHNKPCLSSEIGNDWRSGMGAAEKDPKGYSIRQALYSGFLGGGAGAAMQWWWDSWVHPKKIFNQYKAAGMFAQRMNLNGKYKQFKEVGIDVSNKNVDATGYLYPDRAYGYVYDLNFTYWTPNNKEQSVKIKLPFESGSYIVEIFDSFTGEVIKKEEVVCKKTVDVNVDKFINDVSFIVTKK